MRNRAAAFVVAGVSGGSGKSLCAIGLSRAFKNKKLKVRVFKKGPDFIDAAWLTKAADSPCRNLDMFMMNKKDIVKTFIEFSRDADICIIEGNRGLFDGVNKTGAYSTAALAELLGITVILVIDCTKMTGTAAAIVKGCQTLCKGLKIGGVILNRVSGYRHRNIITRAIKHFTGIPVVGYIPRTVGLKMSERHLGLIPVMEHTQSGVFIEKSAQLVEQNIDLNKIKRIASNTVVPVSIPVNKIIKNIRLKKTRKVGILQDKAFNFYYPENLEALEQQGAEIIRLNALKDIKLPDDLDLLYIGGGFPETSALMLERNQSFRDSVKKAVDCGLPVYAECGGVVYLGKSLNYAGKKYKMSGVFPLEYSFDVHPSGHGYTIVEIKKNNPFFKKGFKFKGHEFHYTFPVMTDKVKFCAEIKRGFGFDGKNEGLIYRNVFATYTHINALSIKSWAKSLLSKKRK